ncbi:MULTISPECIES: hypothetical protein [Duganella]|uniref:hypothetical protein n=1 Tax=Duganella TaxID=75654 RepID=UPI0030EA4362
MENPAKAWSGAAAAKYARGSINFYNAPVYEYVKSTVADREAQDLSAQLDCLRLESTPAYTWSVTNLTNSYRSAEQVSHAEREAIFLRALETTVIFDRMVSTVAHRIALMHTRGAPLSSGSNSYVSVNGSEAVRVSTLVPAVPAYEVVDEQRANGAHRLELGTAGTGELECFLSVVQARGKDEADLTIMLTQQAGYWILTLVHPTKGSARILLSRGRTSVGGSVAVSATPTPPPLRGASVTSFRMGASTTVWGN